MNLYEEYALLDAKITELETQKESLRTKILESMIESGEEKIETSVGSFKKVITKTWNYSDKVKMLEEDYKELKAHEQSTGDATFTEKSSLRFSPIKL